MKLHSVYIKEFKNLINFTIDFYEDTTTHVLIGHNGTGKSNLFEALIIIFKNLDLNNKPEITYRLKYSCRNYFIEIERNHEIKRNNTIIKINGEKTSRRKFRENKQLYLPKYIFAYYSGPSNRLEIIFDDHQKRFYDDLLNDKENPLRPFFYARNVHSQFVLLSFFFGDLESRKFLYDYLGIEKLDSILFVIKKPPWRSREGDERFWNARGKVATFLGDIYDNSLAPIYDKETRYSEYKTKQEKMDLLYLYIKDQDTLSKIASPYGDNREFFKMLESTYLSKLIHELRINVVMKKEKNIITFNELSEGEQQLLIVFGLLKFTKDEESLFLLDEPDTHLNPAWKYDYLNLLENVVSRDQTSQILLATHDPIVIGGLKKEQVIIFEKDEEYNVITEHPEFDPRGMGVAALLTSEMFGLQTTLDKITQEKLDKKRLLLLKPQNELTKEEIDYIESITNELGSLDYTRTIRDPLYDDFIRGLMRRDEYKKQILTPDEKRKHEKVVDELLKEILKEE